MLSTSPQLQVPGFSSLLFHQSSLLGISLLSLASLVAPAQLTLRPEPFISLDSSPTRCFDVLPRTPSYRVSHRHLHSSACPITHDFSPHLVRTALILHLWSSDSPLPPIARNAEIKTRCYIPSQGQWISTAEI